MPRPVLGHRFFMPNGRLGAPNEHRNGLNLPTARVRRRGNSKNLLSADFHSWPANHQRVVVTRGAGTEKPRLFVNNAPSPTYLSTWKLTSAWPNDIKKIVSLVMSKIESSDEYLTTAEVARKTRTSQSYWEKLRVAGGGPQYSKPARFVRYRWQDVAEFMESKSCNSTSQDLDPTADASDADRPDDDGQHAYATAEPDARDADDQRYDNAQACDRPDTDEDSCDEA